MSDPKNKPSEELKIVPVGMPSLDRGFIDLRDSVLTSLSTEEAERVLAEMSADLESLTLDDDGFQSFESSFLQQPEAAGQPSSELLGEASNEQIDQINEFELLARINERVVDLSTDPGEELGIDLDLGTPFKGEVFTLPNPEEGHDEGPFAPVNTVEAQDATGLEDIEFDLDPLPEATEAVGVETPAQPVLTSTQIEDLDLGDLPATADFSATSFDIGDDDVLAEGDFDLSISDQENLDPGASTDLPGAEVPLELVDTDFELGEDDAAPIMSSELATADFVQAGEDAAIDDFVMPDLDASDFEPFETGEGEFAVSGDDTVIATEAFQPVSADDEAVGGTDEPFDFGEALAAATSEATAGGEGETDFDLYGPSDTTAFETYAEPEMVEDELIVEATDDMVLDEEPIDMVAAISSERDEAEPEVPPAYEALEGERPLAEPSLEDKEQTESAQPTIVAETEPTPIIAEFGKNRKKPRRWLMPIAASIAAIGVAGLGAYWYVSGVPGLSSIGLSIPGLNTDQPPLVAQTDVDLPLDFEPVPLDQPTVIPAEQMQIQPDTNVAAGAMPVAETAELEALFAELDQAAAQAPSAQAQEPPAESAEDSEDAGPGMPEVAEFDLVDAFGGDQPALADIETQAPTADPEGSAEAQRPAAASVDVGAVADLDDVIEVQRIFAEQLVTLQAEIADLKAASFANPGQAGLMGEAMVELARLGDQIAVINARLTGVEGRVAMPAVSLPGSNANEQTLKRLEEQMEFLSNNVGIIARMAAGNTSGPVPGFNAVTDADLSGENAAPIPQPRPAHEAPRITDSPSQAAGFTITSKPADNVALGRVAVGDFVENYGYVLAISPISGGGKLVQMENGTVLVE